jgi:hypothetical protein
MAFRRAAPGGADDWDTDPSFENDITEAERVRFGNKETAALYREELQSGLISKQSMSLIRTDAIERDRRLHAPDAAGNTASRAGVSARVAALMGAGERTDGPGKEQGAGGAGKGKGASYDGHGPRGKGNSWHDQNDAANGQCASADRTPASTHPTPPEAALNARAPGAGVAHPSAATRGGGGAPAVLPAPTKAAAAALPSVRDAIARWAAPMPPLGAAVTSAAPAPGGVTRQPAALAGQPTAPPGSGPICTPHAPPAHAPHPPPPSLATASMPLVALPPAVQATARAQPLVQQPALSPPPAKPTAALPPGTRVAVHGPGAPGAAGAADAPPRNGRVLCARADGCVKVSFDGCESESDEWIPPEQQADRCALVAHESQDTRASSTAHCLPPSRRAPVAGTSGRAGLAAAVVSGEQLWGPGAAGAELGKRSATAAARLPAASGASAGHAAVSAASGTAPPTGPAAAGLASVGSAALLQRLERAQLHAVGGVAVGGQGADEEEDEEWE